MLVTLVAGLALLGCCAARCPCKTRTEAFTATSSPSTAESTETTISTTPYRTTAESTETTTPTTMYTTTAGSTEASNSTTSYTTMRQSSWCPCRTTTQTQPWPVPTQTVPQPVPPASPLNQCSCTDKNIWLDVYFLIDASLAMTSAGFDGDVGMWYDLTTFQSTDDMINSAYLTYDGNRGTNIEAAIKMASKSFATSSHRDNAQKVIVIVASDYQEGNYNDPRAAAEAFKEDGGYIITVEYVQEHDEPIPLLANLASGPQFQFTNRFGNLTAKDLRTAFCKANCFCPTNYNPDNQGDIAPLGGCYRPVSIPAIEVLAARNCRQHHNATLAKVEDISKAAFLTTLFSPKTKFWIGLRLVDGVYQWPDGTTLQSNSYQMWAPGYPNPAAGDCVYMYQYSGFGFGWFNDDCGDDQNYVCHNAPCSADNYCSSRT